MRNESFNSIRFASVASWLLLVCLTVVADPLLEKSFQNPPADARPTVWWRFMDDFMAREGIIVELDAMNRLGLSGGVVSYCTSNSRLVNSRSGLPQIPILSPEWWDMVGFQLREAKQRDLDLWIQMCPGYATSGGPWITPEMSMQKIVWSEVRCDGATNFDGVLPQPKVDKRWNFYRDVAVLAVPQLAGNAAVPVEQVINLTERMDAAGRLQWKPAAGQWKIFRLGHTTTGKPIHPVTKTGAGLECDKLNREAARIQFDSYFKKMLDQCPADQRGSVQLFFDSWEADSQNWTPRFREEFQKSRGYDPLPWLLVAAGQVIGSEDLSRRFDYDWKTTIEELINTEHFAELARLSHENGCNQFRAQPYNGPVNFMTAGALFDIPEGEYWHGKRDYGWWSLRQIASVSHVNGKKIAAAESLTSLADQHHLDVDPFATKAETDLAFTMGINNVAIHAMAHNPWPKLKPGMTTGFFPPLLGDWQVWNDFASPWVTYLARCCHLLQQGTFQADVVTLFRVGQKGFTPPDGYAGDLCNEELIISSMTWDGNALCLPGGMRYRVLELVDTTKFTVNYVSPSGIKERTAGKPLPQSISLPLMRKVRELVLAGATIVGPRPVCASGLTSYPQSDEEVARIADELWGVAADGKPVDRKVGKGRVFSGVPVAEVLARIGVQPDFKTVEPVSADDVPWIHRRVGDDDFYFVSNQKNERVKVTGSFRVDGKIPEFWHADTGAVEPVRSWRQKDGRTEVELDFDLRGSVFVRFVPGKAPAVQAQASAPTLLGSVDLSSNWKVRFDSNMGAPAEVEFPKLVSWTARAEKGIRHYSGVAKYERTVTLPGKLLSPGSKITLDLGEVKNLARVTVNGTVLPELWKPPFRCDITQAVKPGVNQVAVEVVNVWANRMIGDEQEPPDVEWNTEKVRDGNNPLAAIPDWVINGTQRPSPERRTFTTWNYIKKGQKILPAGLLGPVTIFSTTEAVANK